MPDSQPRTVVLITSDLMASAQLEGQIRRAGFLPRVVGSTGSALNVLEQGPVAAFVVELLEASVDVPALVATNIPVFAYASHVREAELTAARAAGATALSRGQATSQLSGLLQKL